MLRWNALNPRSTPRCCSPPRMSWATPAKESKRPRSMKSLFSANQPTKKTESNKHANVPSTAGVDHVPRPKTRRSDFKPSMATESEHPRSFNRFLENSPSSFGAVPSERHDLKKEKQHCSPFKKLVKLVSPIKGLPSFFTDRKASKKESCVDHDAEIKSRSDQNGSKESQVGQSGATSGTVATTTTSSRLPIHEEMNLPGMVSTVTDNEGVTTKSPVCRVQLLDPLSVTSGKDKKKKKRKNKEKLPSIPTVKQWAKQEKKREKAEAKKAKKVNKELKQKADLKKEEVKHKTAGKEAKRPKPIKEAWAPKPSVAEPQYRQASGPMKDLEYEVIRVTEQSPRNTYSRQGLQSTVKADKKSADDKSAKTSSTEKSEEACELESPRGSSSAVSKRPLGAHPNRRRSVVVNVQEKDPDHYYSSRARNEPEKDVSGDEKQPKFGERVLAWV